MSIEQLLKYNIVKKDTAITIGVFDGFHKGHQYIFEQLKKLAENSNLTPLVITFINHPLEILNKSFQPTYISDTETKIEYMKNFGIKNIIPIEFTKEIAQLTAVEFVNILKTNFNMSYLVIGTDFALGRNREGDPKTLSTLSPKIGFKIKMVDTLEINSFKISSTAIRKLLTSGSVQKIPPLLGRNFSLRGNVVSGSKRGHSLGFPTANLSIKHKLLIPKLGIYATETKIDSKIYPSCTSIGLRPTFYPKNNTPLMETHIINYNNNIYDKTIEVFFIDRIRDEKKFTSAQKLIEQMNNDVDKAYRILKSQ